MAWRTKFRGSDMYQSKLMGALAGIAVLGSAIFAEAGIVNGFEVLHRAAGF